MQGTVAEIDLSIREDDLITLHASFWEKASVHRFSEQAMEKGKFLEKFKFHIL